MAIPNMATQICAVPFGTVNSFWAVRIDQNELEPGIGSPSLGMILGIPELRTWRVAKFPLLWCYFERDDHVDVVRQLGGRQDIAELLGDLADGA